MREHGKEPIRQFGKISEQVLSGIIQSIEAAVVLHDRKLKVVFVNDAFESIFEIKGGNAIGRSPMEFLPVFDKRHKEAIFSRLENTLKTGNRSGYHEFPYCSPTGKYRQLLAISIPIFDNKNEITHVMSVIHDVTRRKELEKEAVKAAKLSSIADMAYTLAHEINNPLTGIKLGLSTLYESLEKEENIKVVDSVMKDLNRIQSTVYAFLKARKKPSQMKKEELSITAHIIDDVLFHLSGQLDLQGIKVDKNLCRNDSYILIDQDGIHQVLLNVLLNAIQATPEHGKITISTKVTPRNNKPFLCISLADTGIGIEKSQCQEAFRSFYSSKPGGIGLGLSICKNIVASHEGFMELESDRGNGTIVRIYLPVIGE
ncbi:MAG: PAS domain S-box protein [Desulfobacteraceae bacterium]|nr:PAS domain S-box protein [Desulfobacteraceae bacterium]